MIARKQALHWTVEFAILLAAASSGDARASSMIGRATLYLNAQQRVMQRDATLAEIDRLMRFYSSNYIYRDVKAGITVAGIDRVRKGSAGHLGESRDARVRVEGAVEDGTTVALKVRTSFTL